MSLTEIYEHMPNNVFISAGSTAFAFLVANVDPIWASIGFFIVSKGVDVLIKLLLEKRNAKRD